MHIRQFVRSKNDPFIVVGAYPSYATIRYKDGRESTVSLSDLASNPESSIRNSNDEQIENPATTTRKTLHYK